MLSQCVMSSLAFIYYQHLQYHVCDMHAYLLSPPLVVEHLASIVHTVYSKMPYVRMYTVLPESLTKFNSVFGGLPNQKWLAEKFGKWINSAIRIINFE